MSALTFHSARILTALGSLALLIALTAGVPAALLVLAGSPIPDQLPTLGDLRAPISDSAMMTAISLIGWIAWAQVAVSIVVELVAWARGIPAPRLPAGGTLQPAIRKLVTTTALLLSSPNIGAVGIAAAAPAMTEVAMNPAIAPSPAASRPAFAHVPRAATTAPEGVPLHYTVQRRDTLWCLAERHLGDPFRWRELFDLNQGRTQPDGRVLTDPNLIVVGWNIIFPDDAVGIEPPSAIDDQQPAEVPEPAEPSAPAPADPASPTTAPAASHAPTTPAPAAPTAPSTTAAPTSAPPTTPTPTSPRSDRPAPSAPAEELERSGNRAWPEEEPGGRLLAPLVGGTLLAAALVTLIDRLRRVRLRQRRTRSLAPLSNELQRFELNLRRAADLDGASRLDLALRALATGLHRQAGAPPSILAVRLDDDVIEVLLDVAPAVPPPGFETTGDLRGWRLQPDLADADVRLLAEGAVAPTPSLVTVGTAEGDAVLIDIETAGILTVAGSDEDVGPYLTRLTMELATSTWTDHLDLLTCGEPLGDLSGTHRVRHFTHFEEAVTHLRAIAAATDAELAASGQPSTVAARIAGDHGDGWIPTILVSSYPPPTELMADLGDALQPGRGVGVVAPGSASTRGWHLRIDGDTVHLAPHNLTLDAVSLDQATAAAFDQILTEVATEAPDADDAALPLTCSSMVDLPVFAETDWEVQFRVLGDVDVVGVAPIDRRKSMEIGTYLALHPEGVTDDKLKTVFWPDAPPSQSTFNTTMSMVRSALGPDSAGQLYLPHFSTSGQRYRLTEKVTTDLARFEARLAWAKGAPADDAREVLEKALRLVRGQPFDVSRGFEWAFTESFVTRAALAIVDAADRLARTALDAGDHVLAEWASCQSLLASPGDEALYRHRMHAAHMAGNHAAIKQLMTELCEVIEANEPYDQLQPETLAAYKQYNEPGRLNRGQ